MASWVRAAGSVAVTAATVAGLGTAGIKRMVAGSLPDTAGTVSVPGLQSVVTIDRDAWGIPHIVASQADDLIFGNGFVHAQDRLWQMELFRRVGSGRLSELFGETTVRADRFMRRIGLRRVAEREVALLAPAVRGALEAYTRGVNFHMSHARGKSPVEFELLRLLRPALFRWRPEPWDVVDTLVIGKVLAFGLSSNWTSEVVRASLVEKVGPVRAAALEPWAGTKHPLVVPGELASPLLTSGLFDAYAELEPFLAGTGIGLGGFSNSWVVDGTRTASGKPMLANDPHLGIQVPSVWYEVELTGPGMVVTGAGLAGTPGVLIGHNEHISWGITASFIDTQDLVIEQVNPDHAGQYLFEGGWRDGTVVRERIEVQGRSFPVVENVLVTHHGPIISPVIDPGHRGIALRWTALEPGNVADAALAINRAETWNAFVDALRLWTAPCMNFICAHVDGDIGYHAAGTVPIRSKGDGTLPVPGWTGEYEWTGYVPFDTLPHSHNPNTHQVVTANNRLVGANYPYHLGYEWLPGYRARRITDLLGSRTGLTVEDFQQIQLDLYSLPGRDATELLGAITPGTVLEISALARVREWDGYLTADSVGGCIALAFQHHLLRAVFEPVLGDLTETYLGSGSSPQTPRNGFFTRAIPFVYDLARRHEDGWFKRLGAQDCSWDAVIRRSFTGTLAFLTRRLGPDISGWRWGRLNQLGFAHVLGTRPLLARWLNLGPVEMGGDDNTVAAACLPLHSPFDSNGWASSYRQIVDMGDLPRCISMHATGQSGHVASEHYDDMLVAWKAGRYHPMSLAPGDVRRELGGRLVLEPAQRA